jgi:hypothetical protein
LPSHGLGQPATSGLKRQKIKADSYGVIQNQQLLPAHPQKKQRTDQEASGSTMLSRAITSKELEKWATRIEFVWQKEPEYQKEGNPHPDRLFPTYPCPLASCGEGFINFHTAVEHARSHHNVEIGEHHAQDRRFNAWRCWENSARTVLAPLLTSNDIESTTTRGVF